MSNALIELDDYSFEALNKAQINKSTVLESDTDSDLYEILSDKRCIVENDWDEFNEYKKIFSIIETLMMD